MLIGTIWERVFPADSQIVRFWDLTDNFLLLSPPTKMWQQLLGYMASLECFVPRGCSRVHPLQWQLKSHWSLALDDPSVLVPMSQDYIMLVHWWLQEERWGSGVPLQMPPPSLLYTNTSMTGWGTYLLTRTAAGIWFQKEKDLHINVSEMKVIQLALNTFLDDQRGSWSCWWTTMLLSWHIFRSKGALSHGSYKLRHGMGDCSVLRTAFGSDNGLVYPGEEEYSGRPIELPKLDSPHGVVPSFSGARRDLQDLQLPSCRFVCYQSKHKATCLHLSSFRSHGVETRLFSTFIGRSDCLHLSPLCSASSDLVVNSSFSKVLLGAGCFVLASEKLVCRSARLPGYWTSRAPLAVEPP